MDQSTESMATVFCYICGLLINLIPDKHGNFTGYPHITLGNAIHISSQHSLHKLIVSFYVSIIFVSAPKCRDTVLDA